MATIFLLSVVCTDEIQKINPNLSGSKINVTTNSGIRYEGILRSVDDREATVRLSQVKSFGPEGIKEEIYDFLINQSDIKHFVVFESPDLNRQVKSSTPGDRPVKAMPVDRPIPVKDEINEFMFGSDVQPDVLQPSEDLRPVQSGDGPVKDEINEFIFGSNTKPDVKLPTECTRPIQSSGPGERPIPKKNEINEFIFGSDITPIYVITPSPDDDDIQ